MYILKSLRVSKIIFRITVLFASIVILEPQVILSEISPKLIYDATSFQGRWPDTLFLSRRVKLADKIDTSSKIKIDIPEDGYYKIYLHLYYQWKQTCPRIDFIINNFNRKFTGSITLETNRIAPEMGGRWVFKALETIEPLYLNRGETEITLTLKSIPSYWQQKPKLNIADGALCIDYLIVQPIIFKNGEFKSLEVIEAESFQGKWNIKKFDEFEKTGILACSSLAATSSRVVSIPYTNSFDIYALVKVVGKLNKKDDKFTAIIKKLNTKNSKIKIEISNKKSAFSKKISLANDNPNWRLCYFGKADLQRGDYNFKIHGYCQNKMQIKIDLFLFIPTFNRKS